MLELIFLSIFSKTILNIKIYNHQVLAMILTVIPLLLKVVTIVLSFFETSSLPIPYVENAWLIPVGIVIYSILLLLKAYTTIKIKWYMDIKYISSHKLLILYGLIGALFYSTICTISTFNECEKIYNSTTKNETDYFCGVQDFNSTNNETTKYITNFELYFENLTGFQGFLEVLAVFLGAVSFFFYKYFSLIIIKYLSPIHLMFVIPPFYLILKLTILGYNYLYHIKNENKGIFDNNTIDQSNYKSKFILDSIGDIFCIISNLIYLEILQLNFCNLNYNLRNAIIERGLQDFYGDDEEYDIFNEDNDQKQEENMKESINNIANIELNFH